MNEIVLLLSILFSALGTLVVGVSAYLLWKQIKETHEWNRRKTSQETLSQLVTGEFPHLREKVEREFGCKVWDHSETYDSKIANLDQQQKGELEYQLVRLLNILETIVINIKNNIVDEDMCYDYLGWILIEYARWANSLIEDRRKKAGDPRVLKDFTDYAHSWSLRLAGEKKAMVDGASVKGKPKL